MAKNRSHTLYTGGTLVLTIDIINIHDVYGSHSEVELKADTYDTYAGPLRALLAKNREFCAPHLNNGIDLSRAPNPLKFASNTAE